MRGSFVFSAQPDPVTLTAVSGLVDAGTIKPEVSTVLPLQDVGRGHELSESKHTRGKIVLQVAA